MSTENRLAKKEFRKRGPGKRNVQADTLKIVSTASKTGRKLSIERESNKLKSALIKNEEIKDLPRFRSRMNVNNQHANNKNIDNQERNESQVANELNVYESKSNPGDNNEDLDSNRVKIEREERLEGASQGANRDTSYDFQYEDGFVNDFDQVSTSDANLSQTLNQENTKKHEKRGRGRPRKVTKAEDIAAIPKIKKKRGRPRKGTETTSHNENKALDTPRRSARILTKEVPSYRIEKKLDKKESFKSVPRKRKTLTSSVYENKKPVSLAKVRPNETQKPMYINIERIKMNQNRDKRLRVNTLDVLKHLIENFNPINSDSPTVNESLIHSEFKNHVLHHLGYLFDAHANINDISQEINEIQKKKTQLRNKIFELKKIHADIGSELNKMRGNYQDERSKFHNFSKMTNKLQSLSSIVDGFKSDTFSAEKSEQNSNNIGDTIDKDIFTLNKIVNPNSGMFKKLILINEKLSKIENELS